MPRMRNAHTGVVVNVDEAFADRLRGADWADVEPEKKAPAKKSASGKSQK